MQVHEKSVLFPLLPISLLAMEHPRLAAWVPAMAAFSMFPLLKKDQLQVAYIGCLTIWAALVAPDESSEVSAVTNNEEEKNLQPSQQTNTGRFCWQGPRLSVLSWLVLISCSCVHLAAAFFRPPEQLPFLHDLMFMSVSFCSFAFLWLFLVQRILGADVHD